MPDLTEENETVKTAKTHNPLANKGLYVSWDTFQK
jgi:hypothetical protein